MRTPIFDLELLPAMGRGFPQLNRAGVAAIGLAAALLLSACASSGVTVANADTEQLAPVQSGNVSTSALPPIGPNGEVQGPNDVAAADTQPGVTGGLQTATADGTAPGVGALPNSSGRDLTGGVTVEKLLGPRAVVSGAAPIA